MTWSSLFTSILGQRTKLSRASIYLSRVKKSRPNNLKAYTLLSWKPSLDRAIYEIDEKISFLLYFVILKILYLKGARKALLIMFSKCVRFQICTGLYWQRFMNLFYLSSKAPQFLEVRGVVCSSATLPQPPMPSQASHICFVSFGHDVKILKIECLGLGLCLVVKSYTVLFLLFAVCLWSFPAEVLELTRGSYIRSRVFLIRSL